MVNFMMAVNRYCSDCMKEGQFLPLRFVMVNIHSGMWMCPKTECVFPMNSRMMKDYIEEGLTTEQVLQLTKKGKGRRKSELKNSIEVTKERLQNLHTTCTSTSRTSEESFASSSTSISKYSSSIVSIDDNVSISSSSCASTKKTCYPLWENTNLLCWLDAALAMLVLNVSMDKLLGDEQCLIGHLFTEYKKILISYNTFFDYKSVQKQMERLRNNILKFLQPKLIANYSDEDSPLVCLPLVLRTSKQLTEALEISYKCNFKCESCGFERNDGFKKIVMSLPNTGPDLNFSNNIYFSRCCYKCFSNHQKTRYVVEKYPSVMFVHFPQGVQTKRYWVDFNFVTDEGEHYIVTQIIQFLNKKRHFILWSYDYQEKLWCEVDDLKDPVVRHQHKRPRCRPHEVHLIIWERLSFLDSLPRKENSLVDELNSPSSLGGSASTSAVSILVSPDGLSSVPSQFGSRVSSTRASLSSSDNVSACGRGIQTSTPFRSAKDVKGLRNTPRYEPYVSRKCRKGADQHYVGSESSSVDHPLASPNESRKSSVSTGNTSSLDMDERKRCAVDSQTRSYGKEVGRDNVSLDFLKGVLSEQSISEDLLTLCDNKEPPERESIETFNLEANSEATIAVDGSGDQQTSAMEEGRQETTVVENRKGDVDPDDSMTDLYALFDD